MWYPGVDMDCFSRSKWKKISFVCTNLNIHHNCSLNPVTRKKHWRDFSLADWQPYHFYERVSNPGCNSKLIWPQAWCFISPVYKASLQEPFFHLAFIKGGSTGFVPNRHFISLCHGTALPGSCGFCPHPVPEGLGRREAFIWVKLGSLTFLNHDASIPGMITQAKVQIINWYVQKEIFLSQPIPSFVVFSRDYNHRGSAKPLIESGQMNNEYWTIIYRQNPITEISPNSKTQRVSRRLLENYRHATPQHNIVPSLRYSKQISMWVSLEHI